MELLPLGGEDLGLLLAHGAAQQVGAAEGVAGELAGDCHDLLLVDEQMEGVPEDRLEGFLQLGVDGLDLLAPGLAVRVVHVGVRGHRAGAVQGEGGRDVLEPGRLHGFEQCAHTAAVELEDAEGVARGEQFVRVLVVERDDDLVGDVAVARVDGGQMDTAVLTDVLDGVVDDAQVPQTQEVHLDQPHVFATGVVEAGDLDAVLGPHVQRDPVGQLGLGEDDRGRVHSGAAKVRPSTPLAVSMTFLTSGSFSYSARISPHSP